MIAMKVLFEHLLKKKKIEEPFGIFLSIFEGSYARNTRG